MSGWYDLLGILDEAREEARQAREEHPTACPNDGEPLIETDTGKLRCRFDGWTYPDDGKGFT